MRPWLFPRSDPFQYGPQAAFISESFPGSVRYSGSALGYQLASITVGGAVRAKMSCGNERRPHLEGIDAE